MDDPPPTNHVLAANGAANQRPLREYAAPQVQLGQLASVINNRNQGNLPSKTEVNPRELGNAITLRSSKELGETSERKENEEVEKDEVNEHEEQAEIDERKNESNSRAISGEPESDDISHSEYHLAMNNGHFDKAHPPSIRHLQ
ncbi:hypothetical protein Dimus_033739, partial [Dionaea muscipula]